MRGEPTSFWGKLEPDEWHPLVDHCADVAACCEALLEQPVIRHRFAGLAGRPDLDRPTVERLCVLAGLHDVGKFNTGFQNRAFSSARPQAGHVREVLALFGSAVPEVQQLAKAIVFDTWCDWTGGDDQVAGNYLVTAIAHHGRPQPVGGVFQHAYWRCGRFGDPFAGIAHLNSLLRDWFPAAWHSAEEPLPHRSEFQHAVSGLITLADWIGSDVRFFPFADDQEDHMEQSRTRARSALRHIGADSSTAHASLEATPISFGMVSPHAPRDVQQHLLNLAPARGGSITVLEAQTGAGKTEAALARYLVLARAGEVDGLYFALPTRTAATQIHRRAVEAVERAFPSPASRPPVILAVPGYLRVDMEQGRHLPGFAVLWNDDTHERYRFRGWAAENSKRYMAGTIVIGTIDQVLLSALAVPHSQMRAAALLRHLLVVDEVHASDAYMNCVLEVVLERHMDAGGHALLMSATLGDSSRRRLLAPGRLTAPSTLDQAMAVGFPSVAYRTQGADEVQWYHPAAERPATVAVTFSPVAGQPSLVAERALDAAREGAKILVIRNTVNDCIETQLALEHLVGGPAEQRLLLRCRDHAVPHHSRYCRQDRTLLDDAIETSFGLSRPDGGCVAVATQTVQQSLDIDADLMITDLCPMDVLLQRMGRLHRHERTRPMGYDTARVILLTPDERDLTPRIGKSGEARGPHGLGTVYEDLRILEATWRSIEGDPVLRLPQQCRTRVEEATHPEILTRIESELGEAWQRHGRAMIGHRQAKVRMGALNVARWDVAPCTKEALFPDDLDRRIPTRLGQNDRRVVFEDNPPMGPLGPVRELTLPAHIAQDPPADATPEEIAGHDGGFSFRFGHRTFVYDRLGLRPADNTNTREDETDG